MSAALQLPTDFESAMSRLVGAPSLEDSVKSPLRYPGGKSKAVKIIREYLPTGLDRLASPFLGGGSIELSCAADGVRVFGGDAFSPLATFWQHAIQSPVLLSERVKAYHPLTKTKFYNLQKGFFLLDDDFEQAAVYFVLNRCSFSGATLSGGMSPGHPRFTPSAIDRLRDFRASNLHVSCADWRETLDAHQDDYLYLDPPYLNGGRLYGERGDMHEGFDHEGLAEALRDRKGWLLSYNDCEAVRRMYDSYDFHAPEWMYGMANDKRSNEVLIISE